MTFTRGVALVVLVVYVFLWVLAFNGVTSLVPVLAVPLVLAILVAFGVWLNRFMGISPRRPHFESRAPDEGPDPSAGDDAASARPAARDEPRDEPEPGVGE